MEEGWPDKARDAALNLNDSQEDEEKLVHLLRDIRCIFNQQDKDIRELPSVELTAQLVKIEGSPWTNLSGKFGGELTVNKLAKMLSPLGIKTKKSRFGESSLRGYKLVDFDDAFGRYLPADAESNDDVEWDYAFGDPYSTYDGDPLEVQFSMLPAN